MPATEIPFIMKVLRCVVVIKILFFEGSAEEGNIQPPDFRKVPVLGRADWLRITDETIGVDKNRERLREAAKQREALHLHSQEVVTKWSNTVAVSTGLPL